VNSRLFKRISYRQWQSIVGASRWIWGALPWLALRACFIPAFYALFREDGWKPAGLTFYGAVGLYGLLRLCRWQSPAKFSWVKLPQPAGKRPWTRYLLNLIFAEAMALQLVWGNLYSNLSQQQPKAFTAVITHALFAAAVLIMARQAYLLRDESPATYRRGLRTAHAVNLSVPWFAAVAIIFSAPVFDMAGPFFDALRDQLFSAIGVSALLAASVGSIPEREAAQKAALAKRRSRPPAHPSVHDYRLLRREIETLDEAIKKPWLLRVLSMSN
jgi:hypothetical protein